jgi:UDP-N-acetylglucosamine 2-epimerase
MRVLTVVGNRPQFVKSAPLSAALLSAGVDEVVLHTGQHYDRALSDVFFEELGLSEPAYRLGLGSSAPGAMEPGIRAAVEAERPDWVVVLGDTNSTLAGAHGAAGAPVAHIEAGLRSFDLTMPEERNRIEVDRLSTLLLCPDERSAAQLRSEAIAGLIEVVGDVMADATRLFAPLARERAPGVLEELGVEAGGFRLLTIHREANVEPERLARLVAEINGAGGTFVFPAHPRTRSVMETHAIELAPNVRVTEPLGYLELLALAASAAIVVTDSGGLQKEAYWLGTPCITLRAATEWVDTVAAGANTLVDPADPSGLGDALEHAHFPSGAPVLYGDGHASERIAAALYASRP